MPRTNIEPGSPQLRKVDSTTSERFLVKGGRMIIICTVFPDAGTAWILQVKSPLDDDMGDEVWVDTGITVSAVGQQSEDNIVMSNVFYYRWNSGTIGTEIWVTPAASGMGQA